MYKISSESETASDRVFSIQVILLSFAARRCFATLMQYGRVTAVHCRLGSARHTSGVKMSTYAVERSDATVHSIIV